MMFLQGNGAEYNINTGEIVHFLRMRALLCVLATLNVLATGNGDRVVVIMYGDVSECAHVRI